jgi:hypothetical protein
MCSMENRARMMRKVYEISRILNDVVDYLLITAEPEAASRLQLTEVIAQHENFLTLLNCFCNVQ